MPENNHGVPDFVGSAAEQVARAEAEIPNVTPEQAQRTDIQVLTAYEHTGSRRVITYVVGSAYAGTLLLLAALAIWSAVLTDVAAARAFALEVLKIGVLPVLTLVIGYYMARRG
jgi:hypothetical protein